VLSVAAATVVVATMTSSPVVMVGDSPSGFEILRLLILVLCFAHDLKIFAIVLRFGIEGEEVLGQLVSLKFDENTAFETLVFVTSQPHCSGCAVLREKGLNIKLSRGSFFTEAFSIDGAGIGVFGNGLEVVLGQRIFASDGCVILGKFDHVRVLESADNGLDRLESLHTIEFEERFERDGLVLETFRQLEKVGVTGEI
jgi:hypothetical protein